MLERYTRELVCGQTPDDAAPPACAPGIRWKFWVGVGVLLTAILLLAAGVGIYFYLDARLEAEIEDYIVVDSPDSYGYDDFVFNGNSDTPPLYASFNLWHLENAKELQEGTSTVPSYRAVGPFNYRKYQKKIAIQFLDGGDQVSFSEYIYYVFDPKTSFADDSYLITNLNQAYLGVLKQTKGEKGLVTSLIGPALAQIIGLFTTVFVDIVAYQGAATTLPQLQMMVIGGIQTAYNVSQAEATSIFYTDWANSTTPNPQIWGTVGTLCNGTGCISSGISEATAAALWTSKTLPSFVNSDPSNIFLWYQASLDTNSQAAMLIRQSFSLSEQQLRLIFNWLTALNSRVIIPGLQQKYSVATPQDIGFLQWGTGEVTNYTSVRDMVASNPFGLAGIPEIGIWSNRSLSFNVTQSKRLLTGTYALTDVTNVITFLTLLGAGNQQAIQQFWGLSLTEAIGVKGYFDYLSSTFVQQTLNGVFNTGNSSYPYLGSGGLFTTRTVHQWLWGVEDPLLKLLQQPVTVVALQVNQTSEEEAYKQANNSILYTGKKDLDRAFSYLNWQGLSKLPAGDPWTADVPVTGDYGTQFRPFLSDDDSVVVWIPELLRSLKLRYTEEVTKYDIDLFRYRLDPTAFDPNAVFYQTTETLGFANMTSSYPISVFISKPRMLDCAAEWRDKLSGVTPSPADDTFLDIEPFTGYVMDVDKQLQINFLLEKTTGLDLWNSKVPVDVLYPIFWNNLNSEITESLADDFKDKVYAVLTARFVTFVVSLSAGGCLLLAAIAIFIFIIYWNWRNKPVYIGIPSSRSSANFNS